ncbi:heterokaryon incompatibility protein-domain-containing protein, partial [Immersiella caudata]
YACLSYCWGKEQQYTLKNANEATLRSEIDFPRLGQTIQDAITMTQLLGLRYLWVDALCILQDDANDKAIEIKKMASIYGSATLTFYIGQAESVKEGFLAPHLTKPREKGHQDNRAVDKFSYSGPFERDVVVPLDYRAWAFQEFLLSPRILLFMSLNVYWVCRRWHYQPMYSQNPFHRNAGNINSIPHLNEIISQGKRMPRSDFFKAWNYIFSDYSYRKLTDPEDRLDALTGVLSVISEAREDKCHFGHWESTLPGSLMWQSSEGTPGRHSRAPSWSWAA